MRYTGIYQGTVLENKDPESLGRLKVKVPIVTADIPANQLPWALPIGLPAGNSAASGGFDWLPESNDQVYVQFLDGEPEKPLWMHGHQTIAGAAELKLRAKNPDNSPKRAGFTRYGHTVEFGPSSVIVTTSKGYSITFEDSLTLKGQVVIQTPVGHKVTMSDLDNTMTLRTPSGQTLEFNDLVGSVTALVSQLDLQSLGQASIEAAEMTLQSRVSKTIVAPKIAIGSGPGSELLSILSQFIDLLGTVFVATTMGPSGPISGAPAWPAIQALQTQLKVMTGAIEVDPTSTT